MRPCDRLEAVIRIVAVLVVVVLIPISAALGTGVYASVAAEVEAEQHSRSQVGAVVVGEPNPVGLYTAEARVRWESNGYRGEADIVVPPDIRPGERVDLWVDEAGRHSAPPRHTSAAAASAVTVAFAVVVLGGFVAWCIAATASWLLSRHRSRQWDREWRALAGTIENQR